MLGSQSLCRVVLGRSSTGGVDGPTPSTNDVLGDARFGGVLSVRSAA